jgi:uncharacterized membrane protein
VWQPHARSVRLRRRSVKPISVFRRGAPSRSKLRAGVRRRGRGHPEPPRTVADRGGNVHRPVGASGVAKPDRAGLEIEQGEPASRAGEEYDLGVPVDVVTDIEINRPRAEVSRFAADPDNVVSWYENIESVEWKTPKPLAVGSRLRFVARFLGRRLAYTYEVEAYVPGERFVMRAAEGPFPMETTYTWSDTTNGGTHMTLRNQGEPSGFAKIAAPMVASAVRRANRKDLARLKQTIESGAALQETARSGNTP